MIKDIDMDKVKSALTKIREREAAKTLEKRGVIIRELMGYEGVRSEYRPCGREHEPKLPPVDEANRTYTSKIRRGCSGFNHPHFHP